MPMAVAALWVLAGGVAPALAASAEPTLRVLVLRTSEPVRVASAAEPDRLHTVAPTPGGLHADGRPVAGRLRLPAPGPHRLGPRQYRGALEFRSEAGRLDVVNEIPLEAYVAGTLLGEMYASWASEALRAQAVAVRTYALHRRARAGARFFDLEAGTAAQVYRGRDAERPAAWRAVRETAGEYLAWRGEPILAAFHSSSGGRTASAAEVWGGALPYLVSRAVEGEEESPHTYWRARIPAARLARAVTELARPVGPLRSLEVAARSESGRALELRARGRLGSARVGARALREALGAEVLRSTLFEVRRDGRDFVFVGSGHGHGVGMSQWGARALAQRGASYREILAYFYPGTALRRGPEPAAASRPAHLAGGGR